MEEVKGCILFDVACNVYQNIYGTIIEFHWLNYLDAMKYSDK